MRVMMEPTEDDSEFIPILSQAAAAGGGKAEEISILGEKAQMPKAYRPAAASEGVAKGEMVLRFMVLVSNMGVPCADDEKESKSKREIFTTRKETGN